MERDILLPVWINILFVLIAQTLLWVFLLSRVFQHSINKTIKSLNSCIQIGRQLTPIVPIESEDELLKVIKEIPPPTVGCNWKIVRKLLFVIACFMLFVAAMITISKPDTKKIVWKLFFFSLVAYSLEIVFVELIVLRYKHIYNEEIIYRVTDL